MKIQEAEAKALTIVEQAVNQVIVDTESYKNAGYLWNQIKDMKKVVDEVFDPTVKAAQKSFQSAHKSYDEARALKAKVFDPLDKAGKDIKSIMSAYDEEQERIRRKAEIKLREEAMKQEEEARLQAAIEAEKAGQKEAAERIMEEPIIEPVVIAPKTTPKLNGGPVYQTRWNMEVTDFEALVSAVANKTISINALLPNEVFLRAQARSLKSTMNFPGVRAFSRRV